MAHADLFGLALTVDATDAIADWNATIVGILSHSAATPVALATVREKAPDFALGHAMRGLCCMILARGELAAIAAHDHDTARAALAAKPATRRETLYVDALGAWIAGRPSQAIAAFDTILKRWPTDALALKLSHNVRFMLGDPAGMRRSVESVIKHYGDAHPAAGYAHGCHAFALEETGEFAAAEAAGRRALDLAADDAWGLHAVDHVYEMTARPRDGIAWIESRREAWSRANNFRFHVWWHLALHHLELGDVARVLELYDTEIRRERTDDFRDISNAVSLLARLEINGHDVGDRWDELAGIAAGRTNDGSLVFADLHYLLALAASGRTKSADALVRSMSDRAMSQRTEMDTIARDAGVPAAEGILAFWSGKPAAALAGLTRARTTLLAVGGSHAQRDVFERLAIEAAIRAGQPAIAQSLIEERTAARGGARDRFSRRRRSAAVDKRDLQAAHMAPIAAA